MILSAPKAKGTKLFELLLKFVLPYRNVILLKIRDIDKEGNIVVQGHRGKKSAVFAQIASTSLTPPSNISAFSC
jgi:hypothetical protein